MAQKNRVLLIVITLSHLILAKSALPQEHQGKYILASAGGAFSGVIVAGLTARIAGIHANASGIDAIPFALTLMGIGCANGSCLGTTIVSENKLKVFIPSITASTIATALCLFDKTRSAGFVVGCVVVPIFCALNAYKIDQNHDLTYAIPDHINNLRYVNRGQEPVSPSVQIPIINLEF